MKLKQSSILLTAVVFLLTGCAGAYAPELSEKQVKNSYSQARKELDRAKAKGAEELAPEKYERARAVFEQARKQLEELPTGKTAEKFKKTQLLAADASIAAQESVISDQNKEIDNLKEQLREQKQTVSELKQELSGPKAKSAGISDTVTKLKSKVSVLRDTFAHLRARNKELREMARDRKETISDSAGTIANLKSQNRKLRSELRAIKVSPDQGNWEWDKLDLDTVEVTELSDLVADTTFYLLEQNINFDLGRAEVTPEQRPVLERVAQAVRQLPNHYVIPVGSTDSTPPSEKSGYDSNRELAAERALNAVDVLLWNYGLEPDNVGFMGLGEYGDFQPGAAQLEAAGKRRVEFWLVPLNFLRTIPSE